MKKMKGKAEVDRRTTKLTYQFKLIQGQNLNAELLSHYSRYLCVQVAGFAEQSVKTLVVEHARQCSAPRIHRYVDLQIGSVHGMSPSKFQEIVEGLEPALWDSLKTNCDRELDSLGSVVSTRNQLAHGVDTGITFAVIDQYFQDVTKLINNFSSLLGDP